MVVAPSSARGPAGGRAAQRAPGAGPASSPGAGTVGTGDALAAADLLSVAVATAAAARRAPDPVARYRTAHLAAVRGAVALLGGIARPSGAPAAQRSVWSLLADRVPGLTEWSWFLAHAAPAALGPRARVGSRDADDLLRQVEQFLDLLAGVAARQAGGPPADGPGQAPGSGSGGGWGSRSGGGYDDEDAGRAPRSA